MSYSGLRTVCYFDIEPGIFPDLNPPHPIERLGNMSDDLTEQRDELLNRITGNARTLCKRTWWVFLIGGIASVIFGVLALINPGMALFVLAMFFAASVMVDGVANIVGAIQNRDQEGWVTILLIGILGAVVGTYALINPPASMAALVYLVGFVAIFLGVLLISLGRRIRAEVEGEWVLYLCGALSIIWGVLIFLQPVAGSMSVIWMIATWAIAIGLLRIFFAFRARSLAENVKENISAARANTDA